jgi:outer membrane translocation and assembly module TamA
VVTASAEVQRLWTTRGTRIGPALFVDVGRTARRIEGVALRDADVGVGLRARFPGMPGAVRIDVATGLRDGHKALSFVYEP